MAEIDWTDVRSAIPQPVRAENGVAGTRTVEARLWFDLLAGKAFRVHITLRDGGSLVDEWVNSYTARSPSDAHRAYDKAKLLATRWLEGWPLVNCRPSWWRRKGPR